MFRCYLLALALVVMVPLAALSQNIAAATNGAVIMQAATPVVLPDSVADTLSNPLVILGATDSLDYVMTFQCPDTLNIDTIHASIGTSSGGSQLGSYTFVWDQGSPPAGSYERIVNTLYLGVGRSVLHQPVYCEVYFTNTNGQSSSVSAFDSGN